MATCHDVDEIDGSYYCECNEGFVGDGVNCVKRKGTHQVASIHYIFSYDKIAHLR